MTPLNIPPAGKSSWRAFGVLPKPHLLRAVFADGRVPLERPIPSVAGLGDGENVAIEGVFFIALSAITADQVRLMAKIMASGGQGAAAEAEAVMRQGIPIPIRAANFVGIEVEVEAEET